MSDPNEYARNIITDANMCIWDHKSQALLIIMWLLFCGIYMFFIIITFRFLD